MSEEFMASRQQARQAFISLIAGDGASIDLARAALLIAAEEYPALRIDQYIERLEELAARVRRHMESQDQPINCIPATREHYLPILNAMNTILFEQERFRGNRIDYYNPQNSFLNRVLERRLGIPLTLSLVYIEVGKRLGLRIEGVGMPFHFMVRCSLEDAAPLYIDPYEKGKFLSAHDCRQQLSQIFKKAEDFDATWLEPLDTKQLLVRMLVNLKHIYIHQKDFQRALAASDRILLLNPNLAIERRDRGIIHFRLKYYSRAIHDLGNYVELVPQADDAEEIRQQIKVIRQLIAMMN